MANLVDSPRPRPSITPRPANITRHSLVDGNKVNNWDKMNGEMRAKAELYADERGFGIDESGTYFRLATLLEHPDNPSGIGPHYTDTTPAAGEYFKLVNRPETGVNYQTDQSRRLLWYHLQERYG